MRRHIKNIVIVLIFVVCLSKQGHPNRIGLWSDGMEIQNDLIQTIDWPCNSELDCTLSGTVCIEKQCRCSPGFIFNSNLTACLKVATAYGDNCMENIQCSAYLLNGAICKDNLCSCGKGYYYMHGMCRPYSGLHEKCAHDCYVHADFHASSCQDGLCKCSPGYYQREHRSCRREAKKIGAECEIDVDCTFDNDAFCDGGVCAVNKTESVQRTELFLFDENAEKNSWKSSFKVGDKCKTDEDCKDLGNAKCGPLETCVCNRAYFASSSGKCVPEIGEPCKVNDALPMKYAVCKNDRWTCRTGFVVNDNNRSCKKAAKNYGFSCLLDVQCYTLGPDAICKHKKCVCNENSEYSPKDMFCWMKRRLGEPCYDNIDCYVEGSLNAVCKNKVCSCPDGTQINSNGTGCVSSSAKLGTYCESEANCEADNTVCLDNKCTCIENYYESGFECVPGINATCAENKECSSANSRCISNKCACDEGFVPATTKFCAPAVGYNKECRLDIQCEAGSPNTVCVAQKPTSEDPAEKLVKICVCKEGHHYNYGKCFKKRLLGEKCTNRGECYLKGSKDIVVCKNGYCTCTNKYAPSSEATCQPAAYTNLLLGNTGIRLASPGIATSLLVVLVLARFD